MYVCARREGGCRGHNTWVCAHVCERGGGICGSKESAHSPPALQRMILRPTTLKHVAQHVNMMSLSNIASHCPTFVSRLQGDRTHVPQLAGQVLC